MKSYSIEVEQKFTCTYVVEADSPEAAVQALYDPGYHAECVDQMPEEITTDPADVEPVETDVG